MTIELSVILGLALVVIFQQIFFTWQIHKLLNKAMCASYAEFTQVETNKKQKPVIHKVVIPGAEEYEDVNSLLR